jgi:hypothetical protein
MAVCGTPLNRVTVRDFERQLKVENIQDVKKPGALQQPGYFYD